MSINMEPFQRTDISMKPLGPAKNKKPSKNGLRIMESAGSQRAK
jgi:hypothetical protein